MDALSSILELINLDCIVCNKHLVKGSWGMNVVQDGTAQFWRVIKGHCVVGLNDHQTVSMDEGDIVFVPHGATHWIADSPSSRRITAQEFAAGIPFSTGSLGQ